MLAAGSYPKEKFVFSNMYIMQSSITEVTEILKSSVYLPFITRDAMLRKQSNNVHGKGSILYSKTKTITIKLCLDG